MPGHPRKAFGLVSIIIPCYNAEEYVGEAIKSALNQTYEPKEVIVIDDGSTDDSLDVIRSFGDSITCRTGENRGACHARNRGLQLARGEYIKFLDADDMLFEKAIQNQVEAAKDVVAEQTIVFGDGYYVDGSRNVQEPANYRSIKDDEDSIEYILKVNPQTSLPLHRREHLHSVGGFDESLPRAQEYDLHFRLCLSDCRFCYLPTNIALIRRHEGENRITNQNHFKADPRAGLGRLQKREKMIREVKGGRLPERIALHLAQDAWNGGRRALRNDFPNVAQKYFAYARKLHPNCVAGASRTYHWSVRLFGPTVAERMGTWARKLKRTSA